MLQCRPQFFDLRRQASQIFAKRFYRLVGFLSPDGPEAAGQLRSSQYAREHRVRLSPGADARGDTPDGVAAFAPRYEQSCDKCQRAHGEERLNQEFQHAGDPCGPRGQVRPARRSAPDAKGGPVDLMRVLDCRAFDETANTCGGDIREEVTPRAPFAQFSARKLMGEFELFPCAGVDRGSPPHVHVRWALAVGEPQGAVRGARQCPEDDAPDK